MEYDIPTHQHAFHGMGQFVQLHQDGLTPPEDFPFLGMDMTSAPIPALTPLDNGTTFDPQASMFSNEQFQKSMDPRNMDLNTATTSDHARNNGLFTPPFTAEDDPAAGLVEPDQSPMQSEPRVEQAHSPASTRASDGKKAKQSSTTGGASTTRPRNTKKKSSSTRKARKGYKATTKEEENDPEGEEKRQKFLERNRVAASKCRDKKKAWTETQEGKLRAMQANNKVLRAQCVELQRDLVVLKEAALPHFDCSPEIRQYLIGSVNPGNVPGFNLGMAGQSNGNYFMPTSPMQGSEPQTGSELGSDGPPTSIQSPAMSYQSTHDSIDPQLASAAEE